MSKSAFSNVRLFPATTSAKANSRSLARSSTNSDRKSTRLNSSHEWNSYAVFCLKKIKKIKMTVEDQCVHYNMFFQELFRLSYSTISVNPVSFSYRKYGYDTFFYTQQNTE